MFPSPLTPVPDRVEGVRGGGVIVEDRDAADLDTGALADEVVALGAAQRSLGARRLVLAVTWADRHVPACRQGPAPELPGRQSGQQSGRQSGRGSGRGSLPEGAEPVCGCQQPDSAPLWARRVRVCRWPGHDGTPAVTVSAVAEFAVLCGTTTVSGSLLLGDALDLRHRLPRLWGRVLAGEVEDWQARRIARMCAVLERDQARAVDAAVAPLVGRLAWIRVLEAVEGEVVRADPEGHEQRRREAESRAYVSAGRYRGTNAAGMRSLVAQLPVGQVARMEAMIQHLADLLVAAGDTRSNDLRRATALVLLVAAPAQATLLLGALTRVDHLAPGTAATPGPDNGSDHEPEDEPEPEEDECVPLTAPQVAAVVGRALAEHAAAHGVGDLWGRLAPPTSLVLHLSEDALRAAREGAADRRGEAVVARMSDAAAPLGPLDIEAVRDLLTEDLPDLLLDFLTGSTEGQPGDDTVSEAGVRLRDRIRLTPVIDTTGQIPADSYEVPPPMRAALEHSRGVETFPWGTLDARAAQADHTEPYQHGHPGDPGGGRPPPGQTRLDNLGPLSAGHHNLKTHHGWTCHQPLPGLYLWRTPSGHWYQVDHTGTHPLGRNEPAILRQQRETAVTGTGDADGWTPPSAPEITDAELDFLIAAADRHGLAA